VVITGANSAVGLRSMPVRYLFLDEIDAYPPDADSEGDPLTLAIQRTSTFARRKIFIVSTPTIQGVSRIEKEFNETDQRYFFVPCPHCGFFQVLKWENIHHDTVSVQAVYRCERCKRDIENRHKTEMLSKGEWRATNSEKTNEKIVGFHLSSLYSPVGWVSWGQCAQNFEAAKDDEQLLKAWTNTTLGLPWAEKGEAPDWGVLFDRREHYCIGTVPLGGRVLTAGIDVQNDRLEVEIVAWGPNKESWSVDYRIIHGGPSDPKAWQSLSAVLQEEFEGADGICRKIHLTAIDAGFGTQEVYAWARAQPPQRVMVVKGVDNSVTPVNAPTRVDVNFRGRKISNGVRLWKIGVSMIKGEIYGFLKRRVHEDGSFPPGFMHFPEYNTEYFKQLTAEQLVTRVVKGYPRREWQKTRDRNEALDCRVYARAAAIAIGIDRWSESRWGQSGSKSVGFVKKEPGEAVKPSPIGRSVTAGAARPRITRSSMM
jgi:phage terminase large subunit GpA-like protein